MRVLQISEPGQDGVFRHVELLIFYLLKNKVTVDFAYSDIRGSDRLELLVETVLSRSGQVLNLRVSNAPGISDLPAFWRMVEMARFRKYDLIHAHSSKAGVLGRALAGVFNIPCLYTPNAYYGMGDKSGPKIWLFNAIERFFSSWAHTIHVSPEEADFGTRILGVKDNHQTIIPNSVDLSVFRSSTPKEKAKWRASLELPENALILGTSGRFSPQKDPLTLYQAFLKCAEDYPNLFLAHLGTGELEKSCCDLFNSRGLAKRLIRIPYLQDSSTFYRGIDAFALTSRYEGLSFAVLEALASGLPLILSEAPGNRFFTTLGLSHLRTAPVGDVATFAHHIRELFSVSPDKRSSNHRELAEKHFNPDRCFSRILDFYQTVISQKHVR